MKTSCLVSLILVVLFFQGVVYGVGPVVSADVVGEQNAADGIANSLLMQSSETVWTTSRPWNGPRGMGKESNWAYGERAGQSVRSPDYSLVSSYPFRWNNRQSTRAGFVGLGGPMQGVGLEFATVSSAAQ